MPLTPPELAARLREAVGGPRLWRLRVKTVLEVGIGIERAGDALIVGRKMNVQADRPTFAMGSLLKTAGQIIHATGLLAEKNQNYAAAALIRQVVEIEYLTWAFKEGHVDLEHWLKSTHEDRRKVFSPASLRQTSKGRFLDKDFRRHCEQGGHPTPEGIHLLIPGPSFQILLADLLTHSWRIWDQTRAWSAMRPETIAITEKFMHMVYKPLADWGKQDKIYALMVEQRPESQYP